MCSFPTLYQLYYLAMQPCIAFFNIHVYSIFFIVHNQLPDISRAIMLQLVALSTPLLLYYLNIWSVDNEVLLSCHVITSQETKIIES